MDSFEPMLGTSQMKARDMLLKQIFWNLVVHLPQKMIAVLEILWKFDFCSKNNESDTISACSKAVILRVWEDHTVPSSRSSRLFFNWQCTRCLLESAKTISAFSTIAFVVPLPVCYCRQINFLYQSKEDRNAGRVHGAIYTLNALELCCFNAL